MFRNIVLQNFDKGAIVDNPLMSELAYSTNQINRLFYLYPYRFYLGHVFRLKNALLAQNEEVQLISFVRDPVRKALSSYHYLRNRDMTNPEHPIRHKTFAEMIEYVSRLDYYDSFDLDSSQLDWLVGEKDADITIVENAVNSGRLVLLPTEEFDLSCIILEQLFPEDFSDCSYKTKINVSVASRQDNTEELMHANKLPWMERDRNLHRLAQNNLDKLVKEIFNTESSLEKAKIDFINRCTDPGFISQSKESFIPQLKSVVKRLLK
jgi:hypothetical protein